VDSQDAQRRAWERAAPVYDRTMATWERRWIGDYRRLLVGRAEGAVVEVGIGTGANLDHYPEGVAVTGVDASPAMLARARERAERQGRELTLLVGEADHLDLADRQRRHGGRHPAAVLGP
jgi:ubiquinone/menaquinone biosynthesis C-methylase UbiE